MGKILFTVVLLFISEGVLGAGDENPTAINIPGAGRVDIPGTGPQAGTVDVGAMNTSGVNSAQAAGASPSGDAASCAGEMAKDFKPITRPELTPAGNELVGPAMQKAVEACTAAGISAAKMCISCKNPGVQTALGALGGILAGIGSVQGQKEQCKKFGSAMDIMNSALAAYNTVCTAMQAKCQMTCAALKNQKQTAVGILTKALNTARTNIKLYPASAAAWESLAEQYAADIATLNAKDTAEFVPANSTCKSYLMNLAAGAAGLLSVINSAKQSKGCERDTTVSELVDCKLKPTDPSCTQKPLDCSVAANRTTTECICRANPIARGCPGATDPSNNRNNVRGNNVIGGPNDDSSIGGPDLTGGSGDTTAGGRDLPKSGADSSGAGGGMGAFGGGGGGGGLGLSGTGGKQGGQAAGKKLNANILSGYDGGGGGGGGRGYGGDGADPDSQMRKFLPGGANDPKRGLAGARADGMTGAGGLTNWQKVNNRYGDNKGTLLGGGL